MSSMACPQKSDYPAVPSSLNAGNHQEMRDFIAGPFPTTLRSTTPYLGLRARLSQIWINRWTILLLLVLCRLLLATNDLKYDIQRAKDEALSACSSVEHIGSSIASMPHYLSKGVNALAADTVTKNVNGLMDLILMTLDMVEAIVLFVINMYTQTYACLITLAVSGSLEASIALIEKVGNFMNETIGSITGPMAKDVKGFQDSLNTFLNAIQVPAFLGGSKHAPTIDLTGPINSLNNIKIDPTKMNAELDKLNASLPTFADVQNLTRSVVNIPFAKIGQLVNESREAFTFDHTVFPLAEKKKLTFCSDNNTINNFFDEILAMIWRARTIFIVILIIFAILSCIVMAYKEVRAWHKMQDQANLIREHATDRLDVIYIASRPYTASAGIHIASKYFKTLRSRNLARWAVAYGTSLPALFVLSLGFAGLLNCLCQFILLKSVEKEVPKIAAEVGNFTGIIIKALDDASQEWAIDANGVIASTNDKINQDLLGWVQTSTGAINDTVDTFTGEMNKALNATFGGTVLYKPIVGVMDCLIGLKVAAFQHGLTWVHEKAHVSFSEFRPDVFSLGAAASVASDSHSGESFLSDPGSTTSDNITGAILKVITKLENSVREEVIISTCLILIWILIVLIGVTSALIASFAQEKNRGEGGPPAYIPAVVQNETNMVNYPTSYSPPVHPIYRATSHDENWDYQQARSGLLECNSQKDYGFSNLVEKTHA